MSHGNGVQNNLKLSKKQKKSCKEAPLAFPVFDKTFATHTDASHRQLGAVVSQDNHPTAFCSRKLNEAQTHHTTAE
jgi:hypothetical protein